MRLGDPAFSWDSSNSWGWPLLNHDQRAAYLERELTAFAMSARRLEPLMLCMRMEDDAFPAFGEQKHGAPGGRK